MKSNAPIPVTVLTGFLGAGKTTLLNHLLTQPHGFKCAIIINEFGAISIDHQLVVGADEEIIELNNGCLCCRVRGDLIKSLNNLFQRQKRFDYVLVETTGLADPGPIAQTFFTREFAGRLRLDGIVTVADAKHLEKELVDAPEATPQIAFADVVLLNKTDLAAEPDLERVEARIRRINALVKIYRTQRSQVEFGTILNIKARELAAPLPPLTGRKIGLAPAASLHGVGLGHAEALHPHDAGHSHSEHRHDSEVTSLFFREERPLDLARTEAWLSELVNTRGADIYRSKGILNLRGQAKRVVFQSVQMSFDATPDRLWNLNEKRESQLVFIGKKLDETALRAGLDRCIAASAAGNQGSAALR